MTLTDFEIIENKIDNERKSIQPVTPDEEYFMHMEDEIIFYLSKRSIDYAPVLTRLYEMFLKGIKLTEKTGPDFAYGIVSRELLSILADYKEEVSR